MSEETRELEAGDVVLLNSRGPRMTVEKIIGDSAEVVWFTPDGILHRDTLVTAMLWRRPGPGDHREPPERRA